MKICDRNSDMNIYGSLASWYENGTSAKTNFFFLNIETLSQQHD